MGSDVQHPVAASSGVSLLQRCVQYYAAILGQIALVHNGNGENTPGMVYHEDVGKLEGSEAGSAVGRPSLSACASA